MSRWVGSLPVEPPWPTESLIWLVALLSFGVGDVVTTGVGLSLDGVREVGPLTEPLVEQFGPVVMLPVKVATFGGGYLLWKYTPQPHRVGVPLGLALLGVSVTGWNLLVMAVGVLF